MTSQRLLPPETERPAPETADIDVFPYTGGRAGTDLETDATVQGDCPECNTSTVLVQGLADCPDCDWNGQ